MGTSARPPRPAIDPAPTAAKPPAGSGDAILAQDIRSWFHTLSNWGRWGERDSLGTLNLITGDMRRDAARLIATGESISCAWDITMNAREASTGETVGPQRWMVSTGLDARGERTRDGSYATASESVALAFHGFRITHLDALSHVFWNGRMYGGTAADRVDDTGGAAVNDVRSAADGLVGRGVLLDIPRARGVDALVAGQPVYPSDLEDAESRQGVSVEQGDILFVRTGDGVHRRRGTWTPLVAQAGLHASCLPWLRERGVAVLGGDGPQDVRPSGYPEAIMPIHAIGVAAMGLWLVDNCSLEPLAAHCASVHRWAYFMTIDPLRMEGVTGSPVNPIAIF